MKGYSYQTNADFTGNGKEINHALKSQETLYKLFWDNPDISPVHFLVK
jgi:hypothetical protein